MDSQADSAISFDEAIALRRAIDSRDHFQATIVPGWDVRGTPHGGYLLALLANAACQTAVQSDPISIAANFLAPPQFGNAELFVEIVRAGKRQSVLAVRLVQTEIERVHAVVTVGTVTGIAPTIWSVDANAPSLPAPEKCLDMANVSDGIEPETPISLHRCIDLRLNPDTGWIADEPTGRPQLDGWLRLSDGRAPDLFALLMFSDGFPPSIFEATGRAVGHVPTVQLTTHIFARPTAGWIQSRCRTTVQGGSFIDEDCDLWDSDGRLVATARQLALVR